MKDMGSALQYFPLKGKLRNERGLSSTEPRTGQKHWPGETPCQDLEQMLSQVWVLRGPAEASCSATRLNSVPRTTHTLPTQGVNGHLCL